MNMTKEPLVDKNYMLEKFPGKGGWTYALLPEIPPAARFPFGWLRVYGAIDDITLENYKLMPYGNGQLFLPIKAALRRQLRKEAGDWVRITLYEVELSDEIPKIILDCLKDVPGARQQFEQLEQWEKQLLIERILNARTPEKQVSLILDLIDRLDRGRVT
jgi:hypothetical protein